ncbi:MAG TPA: DUF5675 family protein [Candidatus Rifleibacterium sp.]|nr:DUF5675 family protein [Candidatus Rifleibacterium sp.]
MRLVLNRLEKLPDRTLGRLCVFDGLALVDTFATLELPFRNNEANKSSILSAFYTVEPRNSDKFGDHLLVLGTAPRQLILIHYGNYPKDTEGCILIGAGFADINADGILEITDSRRAMRRLTKIVTGPAELIIL